MPTIDQIRAARALIGWSQGKLAEHSGLSQAGIARIENGTNHPNSSTLRKITKAFDACDIEFIDESGVKKRTNEVRILQGAQGFRSFMDSVYETAKAGGSLSLFNTQPQLWIKHLGEEWYNMHNKRMAALGEIGVRIITAEGNKSFILDTAAYRWFPEGRFYSAMFYCYGDKIGLLNFDDDDIEITVINVKNFANGFRELFESTWKYDSTHARNPLI